MIARESPMLVMDCVRHAAVLPAAMTARSGPKQCGQNIQKNRSRTTVAEPIGETLAELPFTGDQVVCLGHDQAASSGPASTSLAIVFFAGMIFWLPFDLIVLVGVLIVIDNIDRKPERQQPPRDYSYLWNKPAATAKPEKQSDKWDAVSGPVR
jgi:hypothetical protein